LKTNTLEVTEKKETGAKAFLLCAFLLLIALGLLFARSLNPSLVVFSNDGPLGGMVAAQNRMPAIFSGLWQNLNWLGSEAPSPSPTISGALRLVTSPLLYSKIFCPASLFFMGLCAWFCFRKWGLGQLAAVLGALAAALSSHFLSTACWGVASQVICVGMNFLAVGLLADNSGPPLRRWASVALAGTAVGMGVMEGYDIGAIFSLFVAAFALFYNLVEEGGSSRTVVRGAMRVGIVAVFAAFLAAHTLTVLVGTQIKGVAGIEQTPEAKAARWDFATQWSFPPQEVLRGIIPGLFGYRMDTPKELPESLQGWFSGGAYWGRAGETPGWTENHKDPEWARTHQGAFGRFSGGGEYAGVLVVALALWGFLESLRGRNSIYNPLHRKLVWFWGLAAFVSLLLAFGHYAPFYQFFYMLPYFSTIRNPAKFTHTFHWALVILFAYGVHGLSARYLQGPLATTQRLTDHLKQWWAKAPAFDRTWTWGSLIALGVSILGWMIYGASRSALEFRIQDAGFESSMAERLAGFSIREVSIYIVVAVVTVTLLTLIISGIFGGRRGRLGGILLGLVLVVDLSRGALPYIIYQNWVEKYATNPVIEFLRERPYEGRVAILPFQAPGQAGLLREVYGIEWAQHHFQYYNIQSLDVVQMPREPVDRVAYEGALRFDNTSNTVHHVTRRWQLTNTKYLLGPAGFVEGLNQQLDPVLKRFRPALRFDLAPKPNIAEPKALDELTAVLNTNGQFAVIEFTGALPRTRLYTSWQVSTNDQTTLNLLPSLEFDPTRTVLVSDPIPASDIAATNNSPGMVEFTSYAPKDIRLRAKATSPSVLLLNDRYDPNWRVTVDGKPAALLRCNYLMRGVQVPAGDHEVRFVFAPSLTGLYVSLVAVVVGILLIGIVAYTRPREASPEAQAGH
jgi:hypothetical protein